MVFNLCVTGPNVLGGAQRVTAHATSLHELIAALQRDVIFYPPEASNVVAVCALDEEFNEYVLLSTLDRLPTKAKIAVQVDTQDLRGSTKDSAIAYAMDLVASAPGRVPVGGAAVAGWISDAVRASKGFVSWEANPAFSQLRAIVEAVAAGTFGGVKGSSSSSVSSPAAPPPAALGPEASVPAGASSGARKAAAPSRGRKSAPPVSTAGAAQEVPAAAAAATASASNQVASRVAQSVSDTVTVYCVYSGNNSQRAKAILVDRHRPYLEGILTILHQKFKTEVVLGYIHEDGSCMEVLTDKDLAHVLRLHLTADAVTLHCWAAAGCHLDQTTYTLVPAGASAAPSESGRASHKSAKSSAKSIRTTASGKLDVSGAPLTDDELRELFDELDVDRSGALDREEFKRYYTQHYDSMGISDYEAKFDQFLASTGAFGDAKITFDEFALVMLKLAQL